MVNVVLLPALASDPFALSELAAAPPAWIAPTGYVSVGASSSAAYQRSMHEPPPPAAPPDAVDADVSLAPPPPAPPPPTKVRRISSAQLSFVHVAEEPDVNRSNFAPVRYETTMTMPFPPAPP